MTPEPDKAYELVYEYYTFPSDLSAATDAPTIPERFQHVIVDGAMHYGYLFRGNTQDAMVMKEKFDEGIKYINKEIEQEGVREEFNKITALTGAGVFPNETKI